MDITTQISELKNKLSEENLKGQPDSNVIASLREEIAKLELTQISFTVSARTARLIGQENFANADGAIIELVKNSYDADGKNAIVLFDNIDSNPTKHSIFIIDNGSGMNKEIIKSYWMMIGTDNKENEFETTSGRVKSGAKGIGRFALDRLGEIAEMFTLPKQSLNGHYWKVNWNDFKQKGISISDVKATLDDIQNFDYKNKITELSNNFPKLKEYLKIIDFSNGTLIKISGIRDLWTESEISRLFNNLEILIPPKEQPVFKVALFAKNEPLEYGELTGAYYDDYDYKISANFSNELIEGQEDKKVHITIERNELDIKKLESSFIDVFSMPLMQKEKFDLELFKTGKTKKTFLLNEFAKGYSDLNSDLLEKIGKFNFTFYYVKLLKEGDSKIFPYKNFNSSTRKAWMNKFGGVKIFRDDFRVRPYGEYGQDWLKLGERASQSPQGAGQRIGAYRIRPNQISGTINISRITNISFQDKSGREGIQENDVFDLFKSIIINIINQFEKDRNIVMFSFAELFKKNNEEEAAKREAEELAKKILEEEEQKKIQTDNTQNANNSSQNNNSSNHSESEITLAKGFQAKDDEIQEKDVEIRMLRSLSGIGLIVASFAHELRSLRSLLVSRTDDLKDSIEKLIDAKKLKSIPNDENPLTMLNHMREQDVQIKHWLDYSLSALKRDKRTRTNLDVVDYFSSFKSNWDSALSRRKVSLTIVNKLKSSLYIRAFGIDFDTIFNNLLANSMDSFKRRKDNTERKVLIEIEKEREFLKIDFSDTGAGLSKDYSRNPEEIFLAFETSKIDRKGNKIGTGMGMYLVNSIIEDYKGDIQILEKENGFKLGITLPLRKNNNDGN